MGYWKTSLISLSNILSAFVAITFTFISPSYNITSSSVSETTQTLFSLSSSDDLDTVNID